MDAEMTEIKERLTMVEASQAHLLQQTCSRYEDFLSGRGRQVKVLIALVAIDILIRLWQWQ